MRHQVGTRRATQTASGAHLGSRLDVPESGAAGGESGRGRVAALEGLRALSMVAILLYHADPSWLPGGFFLLHGVFWLLLAFLLRRVTLPPLYTGMVVATFILFSVLLVWFPYITRIHMGLYALAAPCAGLAVEKLRQRWQTGLLVLLLLGALPPLLLNQTRPLLPEQCVQFIWHRDVRDCWSNPREQLYFNTRPEIRDTYIASANAIAAANPAVVGVRLWQDGWEYPLWGLLRNRMEHLPRIVHVLGENDRPIRAMRESEQTPDVIFELPETNMLKTQPHVIVP